MRSNALGAFVAFAHFFILIYSFCRIWRESARKQTSEGGSGKARKKKRQAKKSRGNLPKQIDVFQKTRRNVEQNERQRSNIFFLPFLPSRLEIIRATSSFSRRHPRFILPPRIHSLNSKTRVDTIFSTVFPPILSASPLSRQPTWSYPYYLHIFPFLLRNTLKILLMISTFSPF